MNPSALSEEVTTRSASASQSAIAGLPAKASIPATVVSAAGRSVTEQPSTVVSVNVPAIAGAVISWTVTVAVQFDTLSLLSVTVNVTVCPAIRWLALNVSMSRLKDLMPAASLDPLLI